MNSSSLKLALMSVSFITLLAFSVMVLLVWGREDCSYVGVAAWSLSLMLWNSVLILLSIFIELWEQRQ